MASNKDKFSLREKQIVALYKKGLSQKMAAEKLGISVNTVRTETQKTYAKANVNSVTQMLNYADKHPEEFIISPEDDK